jgi:hypothetical protein
LPPEASHKNPLTKNPEIIKVILISSRSQESCVAIKIPAWYNETVKAGET